MRDTGGDSESEMSVLGNWGEITQGKGKRESSSQHSDWRCTQHMNYGHPQLSSKRLKTELI